MKLLIDENLPYNFSLWKKYDSEYVATNKHLRTDREIWEYAKKHEMIIVTKDADFSDYMLLNEPPPKVIHIKIGNMKMNQLHFFLNVIWEKVFVLMDNYKLLNIYTDRLEGVK